MIPQNKQACKLMLDGAKTLAKVSHNGIKIDESYLTKEAIPQTQSRLAWLREEIQKTDAGKTWRRVYGSRMKLKASSQLADVLFRVMGIKRPLMKLTKKGKLANDSEVLEKVKHPIVPLYLEFSRLNKVYDTYLLGIQREIVGGFLHPNFNLHTTVTFRSSSSNPNFQNIPIRNKQQAALIRKLFVARKGNNLIDCDYSGIEVRIAACYNHDSQLIKYITDPTTDMHRDMAAEIFNILPKIVNKEIRHAAKNMFVFPEFYGSYYKQCAPNLWNAMYEGKWKVCRDGLRKLNIKKLGNLVYDEKPEPQTFEAHIQDIEKDFWGNRFSEYAQWKRDQWDTYCENGYVDTLTGFRLVALMNRKEVSNYPIQGSAFHCLLLALILLQKEIEKRKMRTLIIGQIHDSILADVPPDEYNEYLELINEIMTVRVPQIYDWITVPIEIEAEVAAVGDSWHNKQSIKL